jgi:hypothetical protein
VWVLAVASNRPPTAVCQNVTVAAGPACTAAASIDVGSFDPDSDAITLTQSPPGPYPLGTTLVTLTATDPAGLSSSCTATVTVVDQTPPVINSIAASPNTLWPPNHKMVPVMVTADATDDCGAPSCKIISVTSNEPAGADGVATDDAVITGGLTLNLRAERSGFGSGRIYTILIQCTDGSGNSVTKTVTSVYRTTEGIDVPLAGGGRRSRWVEQESRLHRIPKLSRLSYIVGRWLRLAGGKRCAPIVHPEAADISRGEQALGRNGSIISLGLLRAV